MKTKKNTTIQIKVTVDPVTYKLLCAKSEEILGEQNLSLLTRIMYKKELGIKWDFNFITCF